MVNFDPGDILQKSGERRIVALCEQIYGYQIENYMKIRNTLYFDHQATTPIDSQVFAEMRPYLEDCFGNPHSGDHALGWAAAEAVNIATERVASLLSADNDEIIFTSGATEANNLALLGLARRASGSARRRILVGATEHKCILSLSNILRDQYGFQVQILPVDACGRIEIDKLESAMGDDVFLVSIMAVNNEIGTIQDLRSIYGIVHKYGAIFHSDGAQAPSAVELSDIVEYTDLFSISAHKMYGPKGVGALYIRRSVQEIIEPIIYGGGQQNNLRSGTLPVPLLVGMGMAAELISGGDEQIQREQLARRRDNFIDALYRLRWPIKLNGPSLNSERHPGNANVRFVGFSAHDILGSLQPRLAASTGSACTSGIPEPSHVLRAIGHSADAAESSIRFSLGRNTTDDDVNEAIELISEALDSLEKADLLETA